MIEAYKNPGIKVLARTGFAALALVAASDINPAYADSQCGNKAVAQYNDMVVKGVENVDPKIQQLCPPDTWRVVEKTVSPVINCGSSYYNYCVNTGYYQFKVKCQKK